MLGRVPRVGKARGVDGRLRLLRCVAVMVHVLVVDEVVWTAESSWGVFNVVVINVARPFLFFLFFGTWLFWPHFRRDVLHRSNFFLDEHRWSLMVVVCGVLAGVIAAGVALLILGCSG